MELSKETRAELLRCCSPEELREALAVVERIDLDLKFAGDYRVHVNRFGAEGDLFQLTTHHNHNHEAPGVALLTTR